jgi:hypothetical protein
MARDAKTERSGENEIYQKAIKYRNVLYTYYFLGE